MAKIRISELEGKALNAAIALLQGAKWDAANGIFVWSFLGREDAFSSAAPDYMDWGRGGRILEEERIATFPTESGWNACQMGQISVNGPTKLCAGLRCFVAMKCKNEWIEIPDELIEEKMPALRDRAAQ